MSAAMPLQPTNVCSRVWAADEGRAPNTASAAMLGFARQCCASCSNALPLLLEVFSVSECSSTSSTGSDAAEATNSSVLLLEKDSWYVCTGLMDAQNLGSCVSTTARLPIPRTACTRLETCSRQSTWQTAAW